MHAKSAGAKFSPVVVVRKFGELGVNSRAVFVHLTTVQNEEDNPKITLVWLQNGALIKLSNFIQKSFNFRPKLKLHCGGN